MTPTLPSTETAGLPFDRPEDEGMYAEFGDFDTPEENARARELVAKIEGWPQIADCLVALLIIGAALLGLRAVNAEPGKMLSMFSGPQVSEVVPTIYAPKGEWKRKP